MDYDWKLLIQNCTGCGICVDVCGDEAIEMTREMPYPEPVPEACIGCLTCIDECPFDAIEVNESFN